MKRIETLKDNQVFVFGSNANGNHAGGAARQAVESFGAIMGQAKGLQGQSYAIVTLDENMQKVPLEYIGEQLRELNRFAGSRMELQFLVTLIGCGIAGFSVEDIKSEVTKIGWSRNVDLPEEFRMVKSYKAFDADMKCRGCQYEVGGEYEEADAIECRTGFHACENPFDVLRYYPLVDIEGNPSRFAVVEQSGMIDRGENKICSSRLRIKAELGLPGFIKACVEWIKEVTKQDVGSLQGSGDYAQIGSSGDYAKITSTGEDSVICCAGHGSIASAKKGSWITLAEWRYDDKKGRNVPVCVKTEFVDGERIKADTMYRLEGGEFQEVR